MASYLVEVFHDSEDALMVRSVAKNFDNFDCNSVFRYNSMTHMHRVDATGPGDAISQWLSGNDELIWDRSNGYTKNYDPEYQRYLELKAKFE